VHIQIALHIFQDISLLKQLEQLLLCDWLLPSANDKKEHKKMHNNGLYSDWLLSSASGKKEHQNFNFDFLGKSTQKN